MDEVGMGQLGTERYFADGGLRQTSVLNRLAFFIWLELLNGKDLTWCRISRCRAGRIAGFDFAYCFVHAPIGAATDEADDLIIFSYLDLARVSSWCHLAV